MRIDDNHSKPCKCQYIEIEGQAHCIRTCLKHQAKFVIPYAISLFVSLGTIYLVAKGVIG